MKREDGDEPLAEVEASKDGSVNTRKVSFAKIFLAVLGVVIGLNLLWFVLGGKPLYEESALRFIIGGLFIFLIPGMIWGELLRFRSEHLYITIAKAFLLTLAVSIVFIPIPFFFTATIRLWVWLMLLSTLAGIILLFYRLKRDEGLVFLSPISEVFSRPLKDNILLFIQLFIIALVTFGAYRWGEDIGAILGEKILHMTFIRYYFSMPMVLSDLTLTRGAPPPNLVNLWEYLVAGWSMLINIDPLYVFYRCRFVIPLLGFAGMFLLINSIFTDRKRVEAIFSGVILMCLGGFVLLSPSPYDMVVKSEEFRRVFSFMGTAHHSDSASDLLVAIGAGIVFLTAREPSWRNMVLLCSVLAASFLWHPREFFQSAIYAGILGLTLIVIPSGDRKERLKKWAKVMLIFFVIAIILYALMSAFIPPKSHGYDEFKIKEAALRYAFNIEHITGIRNLFRFPMNFALSSNTAPDAFLSSQGMFERALKDWHPMPLLILAALSIPVLFYLGDRQSKRLAMFTFLLWFLVLCWNFTMLLFIVLTYSEIHVSTIRILYLFTYILLADAVYLLSLRFYRDGLGLQQNLIPVGLFFVGGIIIAVWWHFKAPLIQIMTYPITLLVWLSVIAMYAKFRSFDFNRSVNMPKEGFYAIVCMAALLVPILIQEYIKLTGDVVKGKRQTVSWHGKDNPFGFSPQLLSFIRDMEPQKTFIVNPAGKDCLFVYYPQYVAVAPKVIFTLVNAREEQDSAVFGINPIFNQAVAHGVKGANAADLRGLTPVFQDHFSLWRAQGPVHWSNLDKVTAPLSVLHATDTRSNFVFALMNEGGHNFLKVMYERDRAVALNMEVIVFGYLFRRVQEQQDADFITFSVKARADGNMSRHVRVIAFDEAQRFGIRHGEGATVEIKGDAWKEYIVTKRIRPDNHALGAMISWTITDKEGWVNIIEPKVYIYGASTPLGQRLLNAHIDEIMDYKAVTSWIGRYRADYILINGQYYDTMKRFVSAYDRDFKVVFDLPSTKEMIVEMIIAAPNTK